MEIANSINRKQSNLYLGIIILSGILFFIPFLGRVHLFDWDEINFAESAREMIVTGNYHRVQINFQPFWEKPPFFFWLQAGAMKVFGVNEFAARFPNAIFGIITLVTFFLIGKKYKSPRFGFIWAISYLGTFLPHLYFKSGIIDPVFNYFIFLGVYFMYLDLSGKYYVNKYLYVALAGLFIGLATLTKGPVGLLVFLISFFIYFLFTRFKNFPNIKKIIVFIFFFTLICLLWFGEEIMEHGFWFLKEFLAYQVDLFLHPVASHGEPFYYHFVVVFIGCFPISIIALPVMFGKKVDVTKEFSRLMKILFWTVMILFSITTTKIVHYSSLTYMPLSFMATCYLDWLIVNRQKMKISLLVLIGLMGFVFSFLLAALPYVANHHELILPYLKDPFARASLDVNVHWSGFESYIGILYFIIVLLAVFLFTKKQNWKALLFLFYSTAVCLFIYLLAVVPKIEKYSQGPAIEFYKTLQGKDVYVWPIGFKSYAQYFYAKKPASPVYGEKDEKFLLQGNIQKPAYFVVKITNTGFDSTCNNCTLIKQEGGFKFYERAPADIDKK
ncbi:glycosyltransferase family 39 protein [Hanamia caeni]|jgi:4-amino-4-deoxy-L-arabinose transferase-like glycosyltransferase|uniref:Glycosyltransferase family 39 protein n=1 Tax=Hanamia caeni TaxID=2294116 RepID=A0A3M9NDG5_9BACT|nr:glycosyltransferase family 39 protein [Hanamia caeni]RNI35824.1 glycosyltransferase family 39 protein [Hanamia caeni]